MGSRWWLSCSVQVSGRGQVAGSMVAPLGGGSAGSLRFDPG
jgi:hypothetical protein